MDTLRLVMISAFFLILLLFVSGTIERPEIGLPSFVAGFSCALLLLKILRR
ncbi:MAG: hypothetical protein ACQXXL_01265 [Candidatus Methanosuratincola sp.]|jgi:hypothetical protein|nr:hypothetical protein [Candidatus Methanosuratincola sp.]